MYIWYSRRSCYRRYYVRLAGAGVGTVTLPIVGTVGGVVGAVGGQSGGLTESNFRIFKE